MISDEDNVKSGNNKEREGGEGECEKLYDSHQNMCHYKTKKERIEEETKGGEKKRKAVMV